MTTDHVLRFASARSCLTASTLRSRAPGCADRNSLDINTQVPRKQQAVLVYLGVSNSALAVCNEAHSSSSDWSEACFLPRKTNQSCSRRDGEYYVIVSKGPVSQRLIKNSVAVKTRLVRLAGKKVSFAWVRGRRECFIVDGKGRISDSIILNNSSHMHSASAYFFIWPWSGLKKYRNFTRHVLCKFWAKQALCLLFSFFFNKDYMHGKR